VGDIDMSVTTADPKGVPEDGTSTSAGRLWILGAIVAGAALLSTFVGIDLYSEGTRAAIQDSSDDSKDFETVFRDLLNQRLQVMSMAAEMIQRDSTAMEAFARHDRAALVARIEPFFADLQKRQSVEQLNFWLAPATIYYRAGQPTDQGADFSKYRRTVVAANDRRQPVLAVETGIAGKIDVRAVMPITVDDKFVGSVEFASTLEVPLERASVTAEMKWAVGVAKDVSERVERVADQRTDIWQKDVVFYMFSDPETQQVMRSISFDPHATAYSLVTDRRHHTIYVRTFPVIDFAGVPSVTIATVDNLGEDFNNVLRDVLIKSSILFFILAAIGIYSFIKFGQIRARLTGLVGNQRRELAQQVAVGQAALAKLKDVELIKRGFFSNLATAINEPLQAINGQLASIAPAVARSDAALAGRVGFVVNETSRLSRLVDDYQQIELFRQNLVKTESGPVNLATLANQAIDEDLADFRRLPQFTVSSAVPSDLPPVRADAALLRRAVASIVAMAAQRSGRGKVTIAASRDSERWIVLTITGSAFSGDARPTDAMLDESRQFMARIAAIDTTNSSGRELAGIVLARTVVEFYGGSLALSAGEPGFVIRMPAAA
jgi:signal transduction histidine kinase